MNQTAVQADIQVDRVGCLIVSTADRKLLLPITAVAEVINTGMKPSGGDAKQSASYGWLDWRDQRIPLLSFEAATGGSRPDLDGSTNRIAILNAIGESAQLGYYGILLQGLPTPVQANQETLRESGAKAKMILGQMTIGEEQVALPDFESLEKLVAKLS
jgi:chemosensory pili system protein ChpC